MLRFRFKHPSPIIVAGPTGCGKTQFIQRVIEEKKITPFPTKIIYFYSEWQENYKNFLKSFPIEFIEGIPSDNYLDQCYDSLLVFDDLINETKDDERILNIFTKHSHHRRLSVIHVSQNLFNKGSVLRTINLNAHYLVLFNNPRDKTQISFLARQMYPSNSNFLIESFNDSCNKPYGYLIIDLKQTTQNNMRVLTGIFENEENVYYLEK